MMKDLCTYLNSYNIPWVKVERYEKTIETDDGLSITRSSTGRWDVYEKGTYKELSEYHQIFQVIKIINERYGIKKPRYFKTFHSTSIYDETYGIKYAKNYLKTLEESLKNGPVSVYSLRGDHHYYDHEYEEPSKETYEEMYNDSTIGWTSIEGFELKLHMDHSCYSPLYYVAFPDPKPINSDYSSWKVLAKRDMEFEIEELEDKIKYIKEYYAEFLEEA